MHAKNIPPMTDQAMPESPAADRQVEAASPEALAAAPAQSAITGRVPTPTSSCPPSLMVQSRRGFLRGALAVAGGTAAAAALAACAPAAGSAWSYAPLRSLTAAAAGGTEGEAAASPAAGIVDGTAHGAGRQ